MKNNYRLSIGQISYWIEMEGQLQGTDLAPHFLAEDGEPTEDQVGLKIEDKDTYEWKEYPCIYRGEYYQIFEDEYYRYRAHPIMYIEEEHYIVLKHRKGDIRDCTLYFPTAYSGWKETSWITKYLALEEVFISFCGFFLHASLIDWEGRGIAFTAPSGTGKSTQAELWARHYGAEILNGDRALIRVQEDSVRAYGSPLAGESAIFQNKKVPLKAIIVLRQGKENHLSRLSGVKAFRALYQESLVDGWDPKFVQRITDLILEVIGRVPVYELVCRPEAGAAELVRQELLRQEEGKK